MKYLVNTFINIISGLLYTFAYYYFKIKIESNNSIAKSYQRIINVFYCLGGH